MKRILTVIVLTALAIQSHATPFDTQTSQQLQYLAARALPANAPHGYAPQTGNCPSTSPTIRDASSLSPQEQSWLPIRRNATVNPMRELLARMNITGLDTDAYINQHRNDPRALPNIGIAASGGGYRALTNGAGVLQAFDSRTTNSTSTGQLGGLLQSTTYLAGLSGGGWLVGSLFTNNFTSIQDILAQDTSSSGSGTLWQFDQPIWEGPKKSYFQIWTTGEYYEGLVDNVRSKEKAGFNASITDYWGRALSFQLVNASNGGPDYTFSSIANQQWFTDGSAPLPFLVADEREPGQGVVSSNSTVYSFSPWELGSEDPTVYAFAPLKYIGTNFTNGKATTNKCVTGFDNVGFVMGTSSSLFNAILGTVVATKTKGLISILKAALEVVLGIIGKGNEDIADYVNPFYGYNKATNPNAPSQALHLVDGGEDLQNIPLHPLIQPYRHIDVIFAIDSSADTNTTFPTNASSHFWPAGLSLEATYQRSLTPIQNGTAFPSIPDLNTFFNLGLNSRPTFFGCDAANMSGPAPLIVYLPNGPYVYNSNVSTLELQYSDPVRNALILNGYNMATQGNGTLDSDWPACVGCAILSRSLHRTGTDVPAVCTSCFQRYCWNGTVDSRPPKNYVPALKIPSDEIVMNQTSGAGVLSYSKTLLMSGMIMTGVLAM